jgi:tetratricopeptide (TPR) repeat protein
MQAARGDILCDLASCEGAARRIEFEALPAIRVKGRERPVDVYRPIQLSASGPSETAIVGRAQERRALRDRLDALVAGAPGGVVLLEGHAGIGKSRLISDLIERAVARGVRVVVAAGDEIERSTPYHPWRAVFDNLLGFDDFTDRGVLGRRVRALVESETRLLPFASLLNPVLRLNLLETEWSERVPPRGRAVLTRDLLIHLLRCVTPNHSTLLVLEDAHWFDSASWALAEGVERELPDILLLVATRPIAHEEKPPELVTLGALDGALVLRLDGLAPDETRALVCQQLRARVLSEPVARLIREKAEGHPFFAEELAHALRDRGLVEVEGGVCRFTAAAAIQSVQLPNTVQVVIKSRIDQLSIPQQLTVKVASVLGRSFDLMSLRGAYPISVNDSDLHSHLQRLVERDLVHVSEPDSVPTFVFKHAITQEVAYSLLPFALRRQLHAAVAAGSERQHSSDLSRVYPLLAYHWSRAEVAERALFYLDKAGEQALGRHASEEALRFFRDAVDIDEKSADEAPAGASVAVGRRLVSPRDVRRIRWYRRLGDASINLGRWDEGRSYFEQALKLIGLALPESDRAWAVGLGVQVLVQCGRRLAPRFARSSGAPELLQEAVCAYGRVGASSYHSGRMIQVLYSLFAALNQAERLAPTIELALARADVGNILGLAPLRPLARVYHRLATQTANHLDDPVIVARILARSAVYHLAIGNWKAFRNLDAAMSLCDQVGDTYAWEENAAIRSRGAHMVGEFELAARLGAELRTRARASGSLAHEIWGFDTEVWGVLYQGQTDAALELAEHGLQLVTTAPHTDRLAVLDLLAAKSLAHLHRAELDHAWQAASRIVEAMAKAPRPRYFALLYMNAAIEVCLARWEAETTSHEASEAETYAWRLCRDIEQYARINPFARARGLLARGCAEWLAGRQKAAHATWRRALTEAERFGLPYEIARVHEEVGRRLAPDDVSGRQHLVKAIEGYRRLKAATDLKRAKGRLAARPAVVSVVW